jgi:hypothetical protein
MASTNGIEPAAGGAHRMLLRGRSRWGFWVALATNLLVFAAANAFWHYLATGRFADIRPSAYTAALTTPVGEVFLHPLNVFSHPWMIVISGLLLGVLIFAPITVAVAWRPLAAVGFVAVLVLVGHGPVLALAVAIGCVIGGRTHLRAEMPFLAILLGLLPAAGYLALSAVAGVDAAAVLPHRRWALYAPLLIAFVAAMLAGGLVLGLARLARFRPGVVCPVLALLVACPVGAFYTHIGADELDYALIANRLQPGDALFEDEALETWARRNKAEGLTPQTIGNAVREDLQARREALLRRCAEFLSRHAGSGRRAAVMWLRAQALSLQVDENALRRELIRYSTSFPAAASAEAWGALRRECPGSPQAALAYWRLGELALRRAASGRPDPNDRPAHEAEEHLYEALERLREAFGTPADRVAAEPARMFTRAADLPGREYYRTALEGVERLLWVIEQNDVLADANSAEALGAYLSVNPNDVDYCDRLVALLSDRARLREKTKMGDNLKLAVALHTPDLYTRADMLIQLARDERTDAAVVANFELGLLTRSTARDPAIVLKPELKAPEEYFRTVVAAPPNPYQQKAAEQLASLTSQARAKP